MCYHHYLAVLTFHPRPSLCDPLLHHSPHNHQPCKVKLGILPLIGTCSNAEWGILHVTKQKTPTQVHPLAPISSSHASPCSHRSLSSELFSYPHRQVAGPTAAQGTCMYRTVFNPRMADLQIRHCCSTCRYLWRCPLSRGC
jgi:hypothetical protein